MELDVEINTSDLLLDYTVGALELAAMRLRSVNPELEAWCVETKSSFVTVTPAGKSLAACWKDKSNFCSVI